MASSTHQQVSIERIKRKARAFEKQNPDFSHSAALDAIARSYGFTNYDHALRVLSGATGAAAWDNLLKKVGDLYNTGRRDDAVRAMTHYIASHPEEMEAYLHRGWMYLRMELNKKAIHDLHRAMQLTDANDIWAMGAIRAMRATAYHQAGQFRKAVEDATWVIDHEFPMRQDDEGYPVYNIHPDFMGHAYSTRFRANVQLDVEGDWLLKADLDRAIMCYRAAGNDEYLGVCESLKLQLFPESAEIDEIMSGFMDYLRSQGAPKR